jgi:putative transposase
MSRPLRIEYPGAWYHVMNRGRRGEESTELFHIKIAAYCLMPNHYHLLLYTPDGNLPRGMRHINGYL